VLQLQGHGKAVSYCKWIGADKVVSASTDSSLRLWNTKTRGDVFGERIERVFTGHTNEKNFVGLSVDPTGDFIACGTCLFLIPGSEDNNVHVYYKEMGRPVTSLDFGNPIDAMTGLPGVGEPGMFVSSICWMRRRECVLVCANSQGRVKVLEMC
jgi:WD40 repeat protein